MSDLGDWRGMVGCTFGVHIGDVVFRNFLKAFSGFLSPGFFLFCFCVLYCLVFWCLGFSGVSLGLCYLDFLSLSNTYVRGKKDGVG